ncbi:MAG: hypothetical protein ACTS5I_16705, partial [Rhodanobacter sp.]
MMRTPLKLALLAGFGLAFAGTTYAPPAAARTQVVISTRVGATPPPPRYERVPAYRHGYVWAPGYWQWSARAHRYHWTGGSWVVARRGQHYQAAGWVRHGNDWRFRSGRWAQP